MEEKQLNTPPVPKKKKGKAGRILLLLILILAIAAGVGYYFYERSQPAKELEKYLTGIQNLDFGTMENMLQSADLSALDNADVRNATYESFFKSINAKMTWKITRTRFSFQDGTAEVTARIRYVDGSDIYRETVTEFLRQIVSSAFSGESLTEQETQNKLASILNEKAANLEDKFSETDILYPMIKVNGQWKVTSLDEETVKIMSANFKSVEDEISQTLAASDSSAAPASDAADSSSPDSSAATGTIDLSNERFSIHYTRNVVSTDFGGEPCLLVYYDYTNNGESASSAMVDVNLTAYQNGISLEAAIPASSDDAIDAFMKEIQPGETVNVCQAFSLQDMSPVTLQATDAFGLDTGSTASQTLNLQ
ncbi:DUF5067 domain-containing protein [Blautia sp. HCP3S3_H10_1]|uniref:DUF5067 domain-containing protein n=1 Tax=unclassified Blautia TaxID=2648079 RepID=UPI003F93C42A